MEWNQPGGLDANLIRGLLPPPVEGQAAQAGAQEQDRAGEGDGIDGNGVQNIITSQFAPAKKNDVRPGPIKLFSGPEPGHVSFYERILSQELFLINCLLHLILT